MAEELGASAILDHSLVFESCGSRGEVQTVCQRIYLPACLSVPLFALFPINELRN